MYRHYYPPERWAMVDSSRIDVICTSYGKFYLSKTLKKFPMVFEQIEGYDFSDLNSDDVVMDFGANIGTVAVKVAPHVKKVIAIEPLFFNDLKANVELNKLDNVITLPYALSNQETVNIEFLGESISMKGMSFSRIMELYPDVTVLKIDCEGAEWDINIEDLAKFRIIEAEIHNFGGRDPRKYVTALENLGFKCKYTMTPDGQIELHARKQ
jgi:hypothetical protein